ncbi:hypothetical protein VE25_18640 [Devosia geojensis]|uniref:Ricin B lectin domain-containing protein n=1 Tax=Devosia geojensis TaxID=443610 RepID=A0A0F5FI33_9HYPH|nr:hypothetical protein [Devosia geojensis]KKB08529.1 hypothetical protein VE25_18640 [Devosia geojensis]
MSVRKFFFGLMAAAMMMLGHAGPSLAQDNSTRVIVPDRPGGALIAGCYRVTRSIYGPYRLTFCLERRGTYQVTGGGVNCQGRLNWTASGRDVSIQLQRSRCGNGVAWSADRMSCRGAGIFQGILSRILVPDVPYLGALNCTYRPAAGGYQPTTITARRFN